jgi:predicted CXXCH cytochrome family protein
MAKAALLLALSLLLCGCLEDRGYRVLRFFFDGVPAPGAEKDGGQVSGWTEPDAKPAGPAADTKPVDPGIPLVFTHSPYAKGSCGSCHDARSSNALAREGNDLCLACHTAILTGKSVVHMPAENDCRSCHAPHSSGVQGLLLKSVPDLCLDCHAREAVEKQHGGIADCRTCHNPHESDTAALLEFR